MTTPQLNIQETLFSKAVVPQEVEAPVSVTGVVETTRLNAEANLSNKMALATLIGQPRIIASGQVAGTATSGAIVFTFNHSINGDNTVDQYFDSPFHNLDIAQKWFKRVRMDAEIWFELQGMKQLQGMLIASTAPVTTETVYKFGKGPLDNTTNMMRTNRTFIPFMSPSTTKFVLPWIPTYTTKPLAKDYGGFPNYSSSSRKYNYIGNGMKIAVLDPLKTVTGVDEVPAYKIWLRYTNIELGVYQPNTAILIPG